MRLKGKKLWLLSGLIVVLVFGGIFAIRNTIVNNIIAEHKQDAQTTLNLFAESLTEKFKTMNYATTLSYTYDSEKKDDYTLFENKTQKLLKEKKHLVYLAYIEGDVVEAVYPKKEYRELEGKNLSELTYSFTLAKVVKDAVVEGPEKISVNQKEVFLFFQPQLKGNDYLGEIVAALDKTYVIKEFGLDKLKKGGYDYELWRVDALGENKSIITASDKKVDFSDALKLNFSLPSTWNISVLPKEGWISTEYQVMIDGGSIAAGVLLLLLTVFLYRYVKQKQQLELASITDPESGLYSYEGFLSLTDKRLQKQPHANMDLLYLQLTDFYTITKVVQREELNAYMSRFHLLLEESFSEEALASRINEETFVIAFFNEFEEKKRRELLEDFILQLYWKQRIDGKKVFVTPLFTLVSYPTDGKDAEALIKMASEQFHEKYKGKIDETEEPNS